MELASKIARVRAIDGGKLENARIVEQITALLIGLNIRHKGHGGIRITGLPESAYTAVITDFLCAGRSGDVWQRASNDNGGPERFAFTTPDMTPSPTNAPPSNSITLLSD